MLQFSHQGGSRAAFLAPTSRRSFMPFIFAAIAASCAQGDAATKTRAQSAAVDGDSGLPEVLATVGTEKVTAADVRARSGEQLELLDMQYRRARDRVVSAALDSIIRDRLFAAESKKTGKTPEEILTAAMNGRAEPTEIEIQTWYNENLSRVGGRTLDQVRSQIADLLRSQRRNEAVGNLDDRLKADHGVKVAFEPFRLPFDNEGAPTLGSAAAPVTLVEFSDFQCPYCKSTAPILKQVAAQFKDDVRIIYRQYPITSIHPSAFKAAEASLCANQQNKFWEFHDVMFEDQSKLAVSDLKATAKRLGMNSKEFDSCLDTGRFVEQVQNDLREAQRFGISGTPAMFINGTYVEGGSVPFATLEALIKKELARLKAKS